MKKYSIIMTSVCQSQEHSALWTFAALSAIFSVMFEIRVEADFSAAHFLRDYNGKCENLHGHNYKIFAHVRGNTLDGGGMLMDFSRLKKTVRKICGELDHTNLNGMEFFRDNPSAERIAMYIYGRILSEMNDSGLSIEYIPDFPEKTHLYAVDVFETETSRARYSVY